MATFDILLQDHYCGYRLLASTSCNIHHHHKYSLSIFNDIAKSFNDTDTILAGFLLRRLAKTQVRSKHPPEKGHILRHREQSLAPFAVHGRRKIRKFTSFEK